MDPWPADSTKRSRFGHLGSEGLCRRNRVQSTKAASAIPIGMPGWPDFAFCTLSIARPRIVLTASWSSSSPVSSRPYVLGSAARELVSLTSLLPHQQVLGLPPLSPLAARCRQRTTTSIPRSLFSAPRHGKSCRMRGILGVRQNRSLVTGRAHRRRRRERKPPTPGRRRRGICPRRTCVPARTSCPSEASIRIELRSSLDAILEGGHS